MDVSILGPPFSTRSRATVTLLRAGALPPMAPSFATSNDQMIELPSTEIEPWAMPSRSISMMVDSLDASYTVLTDLSGLRCEARSIVFASALGSCVFFSSRRTRPPGLVPSEYAGTPVVVMSTRSAPPLPFSKRTSLSSVAAGSVRALAFTSAAVAAAVVAAGVSVTLSDVPSARTR